MRKFGLFAKHTVGLASISAPFAWLIYKRYEPREKEIRARAFALDDLRAPLPCSSEERYGPAGSSHAANGSLHHKILVDKETDHIYLKKGAQSRESLVREFVIANALALIRPGEQPESLILQDDVQADGTARFYTLSRIYPESMDIQQFIEKGGSVEEISSTPVKGFEQALASDGLFAKQQDAKLANYTITKKEGVYVVATIDHEMAGERFSHFFNRQELTDDLVRLLSYVRDLHPERGEIPGVSMAMAVGMAGDARAVEFVSTVKKQMRPEAVREFYERVAETDFQPLIDWLDLMSRHSNLVTRKEVVFYGELLKHIKTKARDFVESETSVHTFTVKAEGGR